MNAGTKKRPRKTPRPAMSGRGRLLVLVVTLVGVTMVVGSNYLLSVRYTETIRNRAELRQALYTGNLMSELQRNSVVPLLLSRDPNLISALENDDYTNTSQRLISYIEELGSASLILLDESGRVVAANDRQIIGSVQRNSPAFVEAQRSNETVFTHGRNESGGFVFNYSRSIKSGNELQGVIVVEANLRQFEPRWAAIFDAVFVVDSEGTILLSTEPRWRGVSEAEALALESPEDSILAMMRSAAQWGGAPSDLLAGGGFLRLESRVPFRGWKMVTFTPYSAVRERVNAILAIEVTAFAIFLALSFYAASRRARAMSAVFQKESAELRQLNEALQREMAEREKAERNLEVAEQTIAQSSKLAVLGEMSAAVSHELNQPLAAMKTYLAGAKLLLQRKRPDEALASFNRIDDLIERMGAITRQLKSYARKGAEALEPVDVRDCVSVALSMMEPQLRNRDVEISRTVPNEPVIVQVDRLRLEQVIINLLRNALDAVKTTPEPAVDILLSKGRVGTLTIRDNGPGIEDLDNLFEPFYTTKSPGDGVGLGLAISSGIVNDFGGRLKARNGPQGGAVFELQLPLYQEVEAAE